MSILPPYPSWEEMQEALSWNFILDAEYGIINHELCKEIYENLEDQSVIDAAVNKIMRRGGLQALKANLATLKKYTEIKNNANAQKFIDNIINKFF